MPFVDKSYACTSVISYDTLISSESPENVVSMNLENRYGMFN